MNTTDVNEVRCSFTKLHDVPLNPKVELLTHLRCSKALRKLNLKQQLKRQTFAKVHSVCERSAMCEKEVIL